MSIEEAKELKAADITPCAKCDGPLVKEGEITFYRVTVSTVVVDVRALQERAGFQMLWHNQPGSAALAEVFAPTSAVAHEMPTKTLNLCAACAISVCMLEVAGELQGVDDIDDRGEGADG